MSTRPRDNRPADNRPPKDKPPPPKSKKPARLCRTLEESFQAGWEDGKNDAPLTPEERRKVLALLRPCLDRIIERSAGPPQ